MNNQEMILEKLGNQKLFKTEIKNIWRALLSVKRLNCENILLRPDFCVTTRDNYPDLPGVSTFYQYRWDLKTCGKVKKIKDYLIFGIDTSKIELIYSDDIVKQNLIDILSYRYNYSIIGDLLTNKHDSFYNFCKNVLNKDDSDWVRDDESKKFFESGIFDVMAKEYLDLVERAWDIQKPLKSYISATGEDIIPVLYYHIPTRNCYYLLSSKSRYVFADDIKLDLRTLSGKNFTCVTYDYYVARAKSLAVPGIPRNCISNYSYQF